LGQRLLKAEAETLQTILPHLFGYYLIQIGDLDTEILLASSRIIHRCVLTHHPGYLRNCSYVQTSFESLPFAQDSIDVILLPHTLEFEDNPHEILREVERVLIPEGHLIILGFNPLSLWGLSHWFFASRQTAPWCGKFLSILRLKDWLALLGFELVKQQVFFFALPLANDRFKKYTHFIEKVGTKWLSNFGAVGILVAKKRVATLTPIRPKWQPTTALVPTAVSSSSQR